METFIRVWENFVDKEICDKIIERFEYHINRNDLKHLVQNNNWLNSKCRKDQSIFLQNQLYDELELCNVVGSDLNKCVTQYVEEFGHIKEQYITHRNWIKLQKTPQYGGYHLWHHEQFTDDVLDSHTRELVWTLYLNDMPIGEAETEFMYQHTKVQPTVGTICIFPAAFTHLHRGLTVYSHPKYIATGWFFIKD